MKRSFAPVVDERTRLLVLGSLPGEMSLARAQYYANPRNQFWPLMGAVLDVELVPLDYEERLPLLLERGVGLWDVVESGVREGSLDAAIRNVAANDLVQLAGTLPKLAAVAFNGGKAAAIGSRMLAGTRLELVALPSSSPAYTLSFKAKREAWLRLRTFLER